MTQDNEPNIRYTVNEKVLLDTLSKIRDGLFELSHIYPDWNKLIECKKLFNDIQLDIKEHKKAVLLTLKESKDKECKIKVEYDQSINTNP